MYVFCVECVKEDVCDGVCDGVLLCEGSYVVGG
jgi:hypothetical protein